MAYLRVKWEHSIPTEPTWLYSELDEYRWEVRKVEIFPDGRQGHVGPAGAYGGTALGTMPVPVISEIAADLQFDPVEITQQEFELVWAKRGSDSSAKMV